MKFLLCLLLAFSSSLFAADTIRLIVPNSAGGALDAIARVIQHRWDSPMVVDNRGGAAGKIALDILHKSGDKTIAIISATITINTPAARFKEFKPVTMVGSRPFVLITHPSLSSMRDKNLRYSTTGVNSLQHIMLNRLSMTQKLDMEHIPYNGGAQMLAAIVNGDAHIAVSSVTPIVTSLAAENKIKILAIADNTRSPNLKNVPTTKEINIDLIINVWLGIIAPPESTQSEALNQKFKTVLSNPVLVKTLSAQDFKVEHSTINDFKKFLDEESQKYTRLQ